MTCEGCLWVPATKTPNMKVPFSRTNKSTPFRKKRLT
jgi:hypothetical protein